MKKFHVQKQEIHIRNRSRFCIQQTHLLGLIQLLVWDLLLIATKKDKLKKKHIGVTGEPKT